MFRDVVACYNLSVSSHTEYCTKEVNSQCATCKMKEDDMQLTNYHIPLAKHTYGEAGAEI